MRPNDERYKIEALNARLETMKDRFKEKARELDDIEAAFQPGGKPIYSLYLLLGYIEYLQIRIDSRFNQLNELSRNTNHAAAELFEQKRLLESELEAIEKDRAEALIDLDNVDFVKLDRLFVRETQLKEKLNQLKAKSQAAKNPERNDESQYGAVANSISMAKSDITIWEGGLQKIREFISDNETRIADDREDFPSLREDTHKIMESVANMSGAHFRDAFNLNATVDTSDIHVRHFTSEQEMAEKGYYIDTSSPVLEYRIQSEHGYIGRIGHHAQTNLRKLTNDHLRKGTPLHPNHLSSLQVALQKDLENAERKSSQADKEYTQELKRSKNQPSDSNELDFRKSEVENSKERRDILARATLKIQNIMFNPDSVEHPAQQTLGIIENLENARSDKAVDITHTREALASIGKMHLDLSDAAQMQDMQYAIAMDDERKKEKLKLTSDKLTAKRALSVEVNKQREELESIKSDFNIIEAFMITPENWEENFTLFGDILNGFEERLDALKPLTATTRDRKTLLDKVSKTGSLLNSYKMRFKEVESAYTEKLTRIENDIIQATQKLGFDYASCEEMLKRRADLVEQIEKDKKSRFTQKSVRIEKERKLANLDKAILSLHHNDLNVTKSINEREDKKTEIAVDFNKNFKPSAPSFPVSVKQFISHSVFDEPPAAINPPPYAPRFSPSVQNDESIVHKIGRATHKKNKSQRDNKKIALQT